MIKKYIYQHYLLFFMKNPIRNMSIIHVKILQNDIVFKLLLFSDLVIVVVVVVLKTGRG